MAKFFGGKRGGIAFPLFMFLFNVVCFLVFFNYAVSSVSSVEDDFGELAISADAVGEVALAENFFFESVFDSVFFGVMNDFPKLVLTGKKSLCVEDGLLLWLDEREDGGKIEGLFYDTKTLSCFPFFEEDGSLGFLEIFLKGKFDKVGLSLKDKNVFGFENYEVGLEQSGEGEFEVSVSTELERKSGFGFVKRSGEYERVYDFENYFNLIFSLQRVLPELPSLLGSSVASCLREGGEVEGDRRVFCMRRIFLEKIEEDFLDSYGEDVFDFFDFDISGFDVEGDDFFGLKFVVDDKSLMENVLNFGIVLEDKIPLGAVDFSLSLVAGADNVLSADIKRSGGFEKVDSYVVVYGTENFLSSSYSNYDSLLGILKSGQLYDNDVLQKDIREQYSFFKDRSFGLTVLEVKAEGFVETGGSLFEKSVYLHQIYDYDSKKYILFDEGESVFVSVFAVEGPVDDSPSFNVENLNVLSAKPKLGVPLRPLGKGGVVLSGLVDGEQNSFSVSVNESDDDFLRKFDHYDVYVLRGNGRQVVSRCEGADFECFYFDGSGVLNKGSMNFVVSSYPFVDGAGSGFDEVLRTESFSFYNGERLVLKNGESYTVFVSAVDGNGEAVLSSTSQGYEVIDEGEYFDLRESQNVFVPSFFDVRVVDDRAPHPIDSIIILEPVFNVVDGKLYLQWSVVDDEFEPIESLSFELLVNGVSKGQSTIGLDGLVYNLRDDVTSVGVVNVYPRDSYGNSYADRVYAGETYSRVWNR